MEEWNSHACVTGVNPCTVTLVNKCTITVWPGILSNAGAAPLQPTGFALQQGESKVVTAPSGWSGQIWGRTRCSEEPNGKFTCETGDCGYGKIECGGTGATPPATLAEFTLGGHGGMDFYAVSVVDGYNLPMVVSPTTDKCKSISCLVDLNRKSCPRALKLTDSAGEVVACKSACGAFGLNKYCCTGKYSSPETCKPTKYSKVFKASCPHAYSYLHDDETSPPNFTV